MNPNRAVSNVCLVTAIFAGLGLVFFGNLIFIPEIVLFIILSIINYRIAEKRDNGEM